MISIARAAVAAPALADRRIHFLYGGRQPRDICGEAIVQFETYTDWGSVDSVLMKFAVDYVTSQRISRHETDAWAEELIELSAREEYFYNSNEYIFTGVEPQHYS